MKTKVTNVDAVETFEGNRSDLLVCKGKLILIWGRADDPAFYKYGIESHDQLQSAMPIVLSETELLTSKDQYYYDNWKKTIRIGNGENDSLKDRKILVMPDEFGSEWGINLRHIADGTIKSGDQVLVRCKSNWYPEMFTEHGDGAETPREFWVDLQDGKATIFSNKSDEEVKKRFPSRYNNKADEDLFSAIRGDYAKIDNPNELYPNVMKEEGVSTACIEALEAWYLAKCKTYNK